MVVPIEPETGMPLMVEGRVTRPDPVAGGVALAVAVGLGLGDAIGYGLLLP